MDGAGGNDGDAIAFLSSISLGDEDGSPPPIPHAAPRATSPARAAPEAAQPIKADTEKQDVAHSTRHGRGREVRRVATVATVLPPAHKPAAAAAASTHHHASDVCDSDAISFLSSIVLDEDTDTLHDSTCSASPASVPQFDRAFSLPLMSSGGAALGLRESRDGALDDLPGAPHYLHHHHNGGGGGGIAGGAEPSLSREASMMSVRSAGSDRVGRFSYWKRQDGWRALVNTVRDASALSAAGTGAIPPPPSPAAAATSATTDAAARAGCYDCVQLYPMLYHRTCIAHISILPFTPPSVFEGRRRPVAGAADLLPPVPGAVPIHTAAQSGGASYSTSQRVLRIRQRLRRRSRHGDMDRDSDIDMLSFGSLLQPSWDDAASDGSDADSGAHARLAPPEYDPRFLDDPDIRSGTRRTVVNLGGYVASILPFVADGDLKAELNEQFRRKHPWLEPTLSLSKVRRLKREMLDAAVSEDFEFATVATAYVYFEKLILRNLVTKANRRVVAAACLILALKFVDRKGTRVACVMPAVEKHLRVSAKTVYRVEFAVFAHLGFSLHISPEEMYSHFTRILEQQELTVPEYLGHDSAALEHRLPRVRVDDYENEGELSGIGSDESEDEGKGAALGALSAEDEDEDEDEDEERRGDGADIASE